MIEGLGAFILMLGVTVVVFAIYAVVIERCPRCGVFFAVEPTQEKRPKSGRDGQAFPVKGERLWRCEHCGYEKWRGYSTRWP